MSSNGDSLLPAIIKITDFPSRNEVIDYFKQFMTENSTKDNYQITNKSNEINFIVYQHDLAYKFTELFNKQITENPLYVRTECTLSFKKFQKSASSSNIGGGGDKNYRYRKIKSRLFSKPSSYNNINCISNIGNSNNKINKNRSYVSDYERIHWADIKNRALVVSYDSPYMDILDKDYREKVKNKKKWVFRQGFNNFIGKASSNIIRNSNEIKNYVRLTPSLPPLLYEFRKPQKNRWVGKGDFCLY